jgi:uncharacterized pyridoxamine 5'-phosphate oxidase family protein
MRTIQDCIQFTNENPICHLATVEGDQPRVRMLGFWFADETGFYFQTGSMKEISRQLEKNPKVEACFHKLEGTAGAVLRIAGKTEFVNDRTLKEKVLEARPFLKSFGWTPESPELIIFRIVHGEAHFWTMEDNLKAKEIIRF